MADWRLDLGFRRAFRISDAVRETKAIVFTGLYTLCTPSAQRNAAAHGRPRLQQILLFGIGIGAVAGFGSGLTGVGGPALSVPLMVLFGFPTLTTIGASQ